MRHEVQALNYHLYRYSNNKKKNLLAITSSVTIDLFKLKITSQMILRKTALRIIPRIIINIEKAEKIIKIIKIIILLSVAFFLASCSNTNITNSKHENNNLWLKKQYKFFLYCDTSYSDVKINSFLIDGSVLQAQDKHAEAILEFQQILSYDSTSASIYYAISKSYLKMKKNDMAIANSLKALSFDENFVIAYDILAEAYIEKLDISNAIFALESAIKLEETEQRLLALAGIYEYKNINKSIEYYKKVSGTYKNKYVSTRILELSHQIKDTLLYYQTLEKLFDDNPKELLYSSELIAYYLEQKSYDNLILLCDKIDLEIYPKDLLKIYSVLLNYFLQDKDNSIPKKNKKALLEKIDNRFYFDWKVNFLSGNNALSINDTTKAASFFNKVVINSDTTYDLPLEVFFSYQNFGYEEQALDILTKFTELKKNNWVYPFYLGLKYQMKDSLELAVKYTLIALHRSDTLIEVLAQVANIYELKKDFKNSDKYFKEALTMEPNNPLINNNYAYSLCNRGENLELAMKYSEIAIKSDSTNSAYLDTYGWINYNLGNYYVALELILKSIELGENSSEVFEHLADIYVRVGELQNAIDAYNKAIEFALPNSIININQKKQAIVEQLNLIK